MSHTVQTPPVHLERPALTGSGLWRASSIFVGRSIRHDLRDIESLLMTILLPTMLMVMFTFVFGGAMSTDIMGDRAGYLTYVVPGIILTCAGFGASFTAVAVARDMTTGTMDRIRTMPIPSTAVLVGHTVSSLLRNLLATAIVIAVALALGFRPETNLFGWFGALGIISLWILAITTLFALIGLVAGSAEAANGYGFILLFLPYLSSGFVPTSTMPGWLQGFVTHQPVTPVVETIRAFLAGHSPGATGLVAAAWCIGITAVSLAVTARVFPRRTTKRA